MIIFYVKDDEGYKKEVLTLVKRNGKTYSNEVREEDGTLPLYFDFENGTLLSDLYGKYAEVESVSAYVSEKAEEFLMNEMTEVKMHNSAYYISREYGGSEEGGWWYDKYEYLDAAEKVEEDDDNGIPLGSMGSHGKVRHISEAIAGETNTWHRPYYS